MRFAPKLLGAALIAASLWACSEPETAPAPTVAIADSGPTPAPTPNLQPTSEMAGSVSLWVTWKPDSVRALNELIETFQSRNPEIEFKLSYIPADELRSAISEAQTLPSLILAPSTWAAELFESGITQDLSTHPTDESRMLVHPTAMGASNP